MSPSSRNVRFRLYALSQRKSIPAATFSPGGERPVSPKCGEPGGPQTRCGGQREGPAGAQAAFSGSPWAPPSDLGPARSRGSPRTLGRRPARAGPARTTANQVRASRGPPPRPSEGRRLRLDLHRARPSPPGLTARRSRLGAAARNMVSAPGLLRTLCLTATRRGLSSATRQSPQRSRDARTSTDGPGGERELAAICPLGGRAANGDGGKLGAGFESRAKVRRFCPGSSQARPAPAPTTSLSWLPAPEVHPSPSE